jgi:hypothetical protein
MAEFISPPNRVSNGVELLPTLIYQKTPPEGGILLDRGHCTFQAEFRQFLSVLSSDQRRRVVDLKVNVTGNSPFHVVLNLCIAQVIKLLEGISLVVGLFLLQADNLITDLHLTNLCDLTAWVLHNGLAILQRVNAEVLLVFEEGESVRTLNALRILGLCQLLE